MEHCEHCRETINELHTMEKQMFSLQKQIEIATTQIKLLREENQLLQSNIKKPNKPKHYNQSIQNELKQCYKEIEKLQSIIKHKDEIIQNQIRQTDDVSDATFVISKEASRKKVKF